MDCAQLNKQSNLRNAVFQLQKRDDGYRPKINYFDCHGLGSPLCYSSGIILKLWSHQTSGRTSWTAAQTIARSSSPTNDNAEKRINTCMPPSEI